MRDPWARHRELLQTGLTRYLEGAASGSSQLVREQVDAADPAEYEAASLVCLAAAEAVGGRPEAAVSGAVSLALVTQMAVVFTRLENAGGAPSLSTAWGMPRALNAGDAFFAMAQDCLLAGMGELPAAEKLAAVSFLDSGGRALLDHVHDGAVGGDAVAASQRALYRSALAIGGLLAGADSGKRARLDQVAAAWSAMSDADLSRAVSGDPAGWLAT